MSLELVLSVMCVIIQPHESLAILLLSNLKLTVTRIRVKMKMKVQTRAEARSWARMKTSKRKMTIQSRFRRNCLRIIVLSPNQLEFPPVKLLEFAESLTVSRKKELDGFCCGDNNSTVSYFNGYFHEKRATFLSSSAK